MEVAASAFHCGAYEAANCSADYHVDVDNNDIAGSHQEPDIDGKFYELRNTTTIDVRLCLPLACFRLRRRNDDPI